MQFALNAYWEPLDFELSDLPDWAGMRGTGWRRIIDTSQPAPRDLVPPGEAELVKGPTHRVEARSVVVLFAGAKPQRLGAS